MKVLIVGGAGYIGGYLTDYLLSKGYNVTVYDNLLFEKRFMKEVNFIFGDIRDTSTLSPIINNYDTVIWLAAMVGDGACAVNPQLTKELNTDSVVWLAKNYKGKIIFPSTCSVYGINNDLLDETAIPNPLSLYAATKLEAETYLLENCPKALVFRLGTLFGLGDTYSRIRLDLVVNILSKKAALGEDLTVFGGEQWRPLLHVKDVSTAIDHGIRNKISGVYNLSYKNFMIHEIASEIKEVIKECDVKRIDMKFEDLRNYRVKNYKILNTGWLPSYNIKNGIKEIVRVVKQERIKDVDDSIYSNAAHVRSLYGY